MTEAEIRKDERARIAAKLLEPPPSEVVNAAPEWRDIDHYPTDVWCPMAWAFVAFFLSERKP
jgi:hypothetical protein